MTLLCAEDQEDLAPIHYLHLEPLNIHSMSRQDYLAWANALNDLTMFFDFRPSICKCGGILSCYTFVSETLIQGSESKMNAMNAIRSFHMISVAIVQMNER